MAAKVLMVGSINMDLILQMPHVPEAGETTNGSCYSNAGGGKGANTAIAAAKAGAKVSVCGAVGDDANGHILYDSLKEADIDVSHIRVIPDANTGMAAIMVEEDGQNRIVVYPGTNYMISEEDVKASFEGEEYDALTMQFEIPIERVIQAYCLAKERGMVTCIDCGPKGDWPLEEFDGVTIISPNETECQALTGILPTDQASCLEAAKKLQKRCHCKYAVLKIGEKGSYIYGDGISELVPAYKVKAIDTTAAGDCYTGVLLTRYVETGDILNAARYATAASAIAVQTLGAQPSLPDRKAIENFLENVAQIR